MSRRATVGLTSAKMIIVFFLCTCCFCCLYLNSRRSAFGIVNPAQADDDGCGLWSVHLIASMYAVQNGVYSIQSNICTTNVALVKTAIHAPQLPAAEPALSIP